MRRAGLDLDGAHQEDGAGTAHFSPAFLVRYLAYVRRQPFADAFVRALPVLGRDGSPAETLSRSPAAGHVTAKTGELVTYDPLNRRWLFLAKGLARYMTTADRRHLAFAVYLNSAAVPKTDVYVAVRVDGRALAEVAEAAYGAGR